MSPGRRGRLFPSLLPCLASRAGGSSRPGLSLLGRREVTLSLQCYALKVTIVSVVLAFKPIGRV